MSNYNISYVDGTLTVTPANLTITANSTSTQYGLGTNLTAVGYRTSGLQNGESVGGVTLASAGSANTANVGNYSIAASNATSAGNFSVSNYNISYVDGTLTVTPANLTVTANDQSRTYGAANPSTGGVSLTSGTLYNADALGNATLASAANATSNVGNYTLSASNQTMTSGLVSNYNISYVDGTLTVTPAPLGISAVAFVNGKASVSPTTYTLTGLVNGEKATVSLISLANSSVGNTYAVSLTLGNGSTANLNNYRLNPNYDANLNTSASNLVVLLINNNDTFLYQPNMTQGGTAVLIPLPTAQMTGSLISQNVIAYNDAVLSVDGQNPENPTDPGFLTKPKSGSNDLFFDIAAGLSLALAPDTQDIAQVNGRLLIK